MKHVTVVIPTRGRLNKLKKTLATLPLKEEWMSVIVVCDGDADTFNVLANNDTIKAVLVPQRVGAVFCRNLVMPIVTDGVLYATDDILFPRNGVWTALEEFNERFLDDDGVLGFVQDFSHHQAGVGLVGHKFLLRYPYRKLFCPFYDHFACQEIKWFAESLNRFAYSDGRASIKHLSPIKDRSLMDQTHRDARVNKERDMDTLHSRQASGLVWGAE